MSKIAKVAPPIELSSPYLAIPTISNSCGRAEGRDSDSIAELEVLVAGDALVDGHLGAARGPTTLDEVEWIEAVVLGLGLDPEGERRRSARVDRLAVRPEQLGLEVLNPARCNLDSLDRADSRERLLRDRGRRG